MKKALFPGTFDPPSLGHIEIIQRALRLWDRIYVAVIDNKAKPFSSFTLEERKRLLEKAIGSLKHVEVMIFSGLSVDCAQMIQADAIIRGLRGAADVDYEYRMAASNRQMTGIETVFFFPSPQYSHVSSTLIREIAGNGRHLQGFVPDAIEKEVFERLSNRPR